MLVNGLIHFLDPENVGKGIKFMTLDVLFGRFFSMSIKCGTRQHCLGSERTMRKIIDRRDVKLPENWKRFLGMNENKVNLTNFLSDQLVEAGQGIEKELVVGGRFKEVSNKRDVPMLCANHEEADTSIPLNGMDAKSQGFDMMSVVSQDTDILVMLTAFASELTEEIWMKVGTSKRPRYIRVHDIKCTFIERFDVDLSKDVKMMSAVEAFVCQMYCPTSSATDI